MPKQSLKLKVAKACAIACIVGMSGNTFVVAGKSIAIKSETAAVARTDFSPEPQPTPPADSPAAQNQTRQSEEGRRYGASGFTGEPINLNVVNADIRDILNYITEQYGINFVIDSSVGAVPVTVNVQDVPWNYALDALLRANRLGVEVNANILRVATTETLAKEAETQRIIKDAQLTNSPLITELFRLNYIRASGTLAQAAGSSAGYAGGTTSASFSGGSGGDATGGGGDQGLLPIIKRRLSRIGSVEVAASSNTLIVTDVKENVEAIRQLIAVLDQPEPQVEIETRIVIAQRNFSRDLGSQLSMGVASLNRGGLANITTLPSTSGTSGSGGGGGNNTVRTGPNPFGVFGGLDGTFQPLGNHGASAPTTVIGLTTGLFGTAQISLAISAAETRGEVKTVATPRITTMNNRPAQIESGTQIPVQTTQATGGGTTVTTTFVSVPLRLSVTPQITDAGTVVLRITIENNTINTGIAVGGVPGIDTQRMQSEVLVPDGGTTVMGGVLADTDGTARQRTPGVASIPLLGNLFKRKTITKNSLEILFFITPKIYRPDYFGRPTSSTPQQGPRRTTVPQPVPLGNPQTNTPTPTELQQPKPTSNPPGNQPSGPAIPNSSSRPSEQK
jgi:type IV pilus assembly protein PilQ